MTQLPKIITSRRRLLLGAGAGAVALAAPAIWSPSRAAGKRIVVRDDGGIYTKAYGAVFYRPFTEATGIEVVGVQANAEPVAQIKTMVETKTYTWDMAKISWPAIQLLTAGGKQYLEKHGLESEPVIKTIPSEYMSPYGVGTNVYTTVLAYRTDAFKGRKAPQSWADFWNVAEFPGRRAVRKHPFDTIEEALMNADACREFIKFASDPKRQAALVEYFPAGLTQPEAFNYVKPEVAKNCPTYPDNIKAGLKIDAKYWFDNQAAVIERFNSWILA